MKQVHAVFVLLLVFFSVFLFRQFKTPGTLETNLLSLLPSSDKAHSLNGMNLPIVQRGTRTLSFLLRSSDPEAAQTAGASLMASLNESGMVANVMTPVPSRQQASFKDLYLPLRYQIISDKDRDRLKGQNALASWMARLRSALYGPSSLFLMPLIEVDPFLFFLELGKSISSFIGSPSLDDTDFFASVELSIDPFLAEQQDRFMNWWADTRRNLSRMDPSLQILLTGVLPIAHAQRLIAENEVFWIGTLSTVIIAFLLFAALKKVRLMALLFLPLIFGILSGLFATLIVFGKVHVVTLTFGMTLLGCGIDYPIHYFIHCVQTRKWLSTGQVVRTIGPGLMLGLGTTIIGYGLLSVTPLPGLRQIAVFTSVGLTAVWVAVVVWLPRFEVVLPEPRSHPMVDRACAYLSKKGFNKRGAPRLFLAFIIVFVIAMVGGGVSKVAFNDDVRRFNITTPALTSAQNAIQEMTGEGGDRFVFLSAPTEEALLQSQELLVQNLDPVRKSGGFRSLISLAPFLPSAQRQRDDADGVRRVFNSNRSLVEKSLRELGIPAVTIRQLFLDLARPLEPLTPERWLIHPASTLLRPLWVGLADGVYVSVSIIRGSKNTGDVEKVISNMQGAVFFDPVGTYNNLIARYRAVTLKMLGFAFFIVTGILVIRYGMRGGIAAGIPPVAGILVTVALFAWLGHSLSLFHVFAFVLIYSMGIDYSVFFMETAGSDGTIRPTLISVFLSALTTLMSFGLLGFSSFPPLADIGKTTFIGLSIAALCSPLPLLLNKRVGAHG